MYFFKIQTLKHDIHMCTQVFNPHECREFYLKLSEGNSPINCWVHEGFRENKENWRNYLLEK